ncbi:WAT1-related protein At2g39510-like [Telopea speciosissima]|uniref:WAT1-related protein At2g39510-like n=1 Tax=Telopea speciosissima TaxID=54955 RepID=UPI001CC585F4|nr:WAT1-related protein At2g39510-like [Telopea speciosissima]
MEKQRLMMNCEYLNGLFHKAKPYLGVVLLQFGIAGLDTIVKIAMDQGMSHYSLVVYRHAIAAALIFPFAIILERKVRPRMTLSIFIKIIFLGLLEPVLDQNIYFAGMQYTTVTFTTAMTNMIPALTFVMAFLLKMEKVNLRKSRSIAKVAGTIVTLGGAMLMTFIKGPSIELPWTKGGAGTQLAIAEASIQQQPLKGALMITAGCICAAGFIILQAITLKSYPAELSLTVWICLMGTIQGALVALAFEHGNPSIWSLQRDMKLVAVLYSGIVSSGIAYSLQGMIMRAKGPVFITSFNPLSMVIVAVLSTFILGEVLTVGRIVGAIVIAIGLYLVVWGKYKDQYSSSVVQAELPTTAIASNGDKKNNDNELATIVLAKTEVTTTTTTQEPSSTDNGGKKNNDNE